MSIVRFEPLLDQWQKVKHSSKIKDEIELLLLRSNILGSDLRITNFGGGNTSCKTTELDPLSQEKIQVLWIKGSGGDLGTLKRDGLAGLFLKRLRDLENIYRGLEYEDEMVQLYQHCIYDLNSRAPSIDTALHGFLPHNHIDHLHPDAIIAIAASVDGQRMTEEIWQGDMLWVPWQRPGFDLGLQMRNTLTQNPNARGIILGGHGLFTWGDSADSCLKNSLLAIEEATQYIEDRQKSKIHPFGQEVIESHSAKDRMSMASSLMPMLRGLCSSHRPAVGHFVDTAAVLNFVNSENLQVLGPMGTSCPDHFLRTKIQPLILDSAQLNWQDTSSLYGYLERIFEEYRDQYKTYYNSHKEESSPDMRDPNPVIVLCPGLGMFSFAKDKKTARIAAEFYTNAINVMHGAEIVSSYQALPRSEAFRIEYWALEEAKLQRMPKAKSLSGRIAVITGGGGGIGKAVAEVLLAHGSHVFLLDRDEAEIRQMYDQFGSDRVGYMVCDLADLNNIVEGFDKAALQFGGVDMVIHSAGFAISKSLSEHSVDDWLKLEDVMVHAQFHLAQQALDVMKKQQMGGHLIQIASKNGLAASPKNVAYGTTKAAQLHMTRLLAAELAEHNIRVNAINPDGVITGSKIWQGEWAASRARVRGVAVEDLPNVYAQRNLLKIPILPDDIANAVYSLVAVLTKTTGAIINVDGGMPDAFVR